MTALFAAALDLQTFFEVRGWRFCFIGGRAVLRWGEPRFTRDVDVTLLCPFGSEDAVSVPLLESGYLGRGVGLAVHGDAIEATGRVEGSA